MGWMQFANATIGHLLSWPVFGLIAVVVFRHQLAPLIRRVTSYEGLGQKLTFGQELAKVEEQADDLAFSQPPDLPRSTEDEPSDTDDRYALLAEQAPAGAILDAWVRVEKAVSLLADAYDIGNDIRERSYKKFGRLPMNPLPAQMIGELAKRQLVPIAVIRVIEGLRRLRNEVAHGGHDPTVGEAITYVSTAREAWEILERLLTFADKKDDTGDAGIPVA